MEKKIVTAVLCVAISAIALMPGTLYSFSLPDLKLPISGSGDAPAEQQEQNSDPQENSTPTQAQAKTESSRKARPVPTEARVEKPSVILWTRLMIDKWLPNLNFRVLGPIPAGTTFKVDYSFPNGQPWYSFTLTSEQVGPDGWWEYTRVGIDGVDDKATTQTGLFGLKITMSNELEGKKEVLLNEKFEVKKCFPNPARKKDVDYYVDQEWRTPYAFLYGDWLQASYGSMVANKAPVFKVGTWFHGDDTLKIEGFLYYKGKKIANVTANHTQTYSIFNTSAPYSWGEKTLWFNSVLVYNEEEYNSHPDAHVLAKNPGDYEIKILENGKLVRTLKFKVDQSGEIADGNGICAKLNCNNMKLVPFAFTAAAPSFNLKGSLYSSATAGLK